MNKQDFLISKLHTRKGARKFFTSIRIFYRQKQLFGRSGADLCDKMRPRGPISKKPNDLEWASGFPEGLAAMNLKRLVLVMGCPWGFLQATLVSRPCAGGRLTPLEIVTRTLPSCRLSPLTRRHTTKNRFDPGKLCWSCYRSVRRHDPGLKNGTPHAAPRPLPRKEKTR